MSERVKIVEVLPKKSEKAPYAAKDGNGRIVKSWDVDFAPYVDKLVELGETYEKSRDYNGKTYTDLFVKTLNGPLNENGDGETPPLGTGEYVRAQTAPSDKQSIARSVALKAAVDSMSHTVATSATPKAAYMKIVPLADAYLKWLEGSPAVDAPQMPAGDEDIPF